MSNKRWIIVFLAALLLGVGVAAAQYMVSVSMPNEAEGDEFNPLVYIGDTLYPNGTTLYWGSVTNDSVNTKTLNIQNAGTLNFTVSLLVSGLPSGWTQTWTANNTYLEPLEWANGTMTLTTPVVVNQTYTWDCIIRAVGD